MQQRGLLGVDDRARDGAPRDEVHLLDAGAGERGGEHAARVGRGLEVERERAERDVGGLARERGVREAHEAVRVDGRRARGSPSVARMPWSIR